MSSRSPLTNEVLNEAADSCVVNDRNLSFGLHCSTYDHDQAATQKPLEIGKSVTLVAAPEHKLLSDEIPNEPADSCVTSDKNFVFGLKIGAGTMFKLSMWFCESLLLKSIEHFIFFTFSTASVLVTSVSTASVLVTTVSYKLVLLI